MARKFHHIRRRGGRRQVDPGGGAGASGSPPSASASLLTREPGGSPGAEIIRHVAAVGRRKAARRRGRGAAVRGRARRPPRHPDQAGAGARANGWCATAFVNSTRVYQGMLGKVGRPLRQGPRKAHRRRRACPTSPSFSICRRRSGSPAPASGAAAPRRTASKREDLGLPRGAQRGVPRHRGGRAAALRADRRQPPGGRRSRAEIWRDRSQAAAIRRPAPMTLEEIRPVSARRRRRVTAGRRDAAAARDHGPVRPRRRPSSEFLAAYRSGRIPHAWLIGGEARHRQGDARLPHGALRARPSGSAAPAVRTATSLALDPGPSDGAAHRRQCPQRSAGAGAHARRHRQAAHRDHGRPGAAPRDASSARRRARGAGGSASSTAPTSSNTRKARTRSSRCWRSRRRARCSCW